MNHRRSRLLSLAALAAACLLHPAAARARPPTVFIGGQAIGRPGCAGWGGTSVGTFEPSNCALRAISNGVVGVWFNKPQVTGEGVPHGFTDMGLRSFRNLSCVRVGLERTTCAVVGDDNALYGFKFVTFSQYSSVGDPGPLINLGGSIAGDPSCASTGGEFVTCAAVDFGNALVAVRFRAPGLFDSGDTSGFQVLGGLIVDNPSCAPALGGLNQTICTVKGSDNTLFGIRFDPQTGYTSGFKNLGGRYVGSPSCVNTGSGIVTCAVRDVHNALVGIRYSSTGGAVVQNLGGTWVGDPSCAPAAQGMNHVICAGRATDNTMEAIRFNPSTGFKAGFQNLGEITSPGRGSFATDASCIQPAENIRAGDGVLCVATRTDDNALVGFVANP